MDNDKQNLYNNLSIALAQEFLAMRKRQRRRFWLRAVFFLIVFLLIANALYSRGNIKQLSEHTALINIKGIIGEGMAVEAQPIITSLTKSMNNGLVKGVILEINSPGGSPVHSALIYDHIIKLRKKHPKKPIHCVVTDLAASGGYYIASACEKIYAYRASIVGSIGVVFSSFGLEKTLDKLGMERRLITAGKQKGIYDPFSPLKEQEKQHMQRMLDNIHETFIADVKKGRGERLSENNNPDIYSGLFWTADEAWKLGLIDDFLSRDEVAQTVIGKEVVVDYTPYPDPFEKFMRIYESLLGFKSFSLY